MSDTIQIVDTIKASRDGGIDAQSQLVYRIQYVLDNLGDEVLITKRMLLQAISGVNEDVERRLTQAENALAALRESTRRYVINKPADINLITGALLAFDGATQTLTVTLNGVLGGDIWASLKVADPKTSADDNDGNIDATARQFRGTGIEYYETFTTDYRTNVYSIIFVNAMTQQQFDEGDFQLVLAPYIAPEALLDKTTGGLDAQFPIRF